MNERLKTFLEGELEVYDGYRAPQLRRISGDVDSTHRCSMAYVNCVQIPEDFSARLRDACV